MYKQPHSACKLSYNTLFSFPFASDKAHKYVESDDQIMIHNSAFSSAYTCYCAPLCLYASTKVQSESHICIGHSQNR